MEGKKTNSDEKSRVKLERRKEGKKMKEKKEERNKLLNEEK